MELCEHGNVHHCQSCEVKQLKYVIEELKAKADLLIFQRDLKIKEQQKEIETLKECVNNAANDVLEQVDKIDRYEKVLDFYANKAEL